MGGMDRNTGKYITTREHILQCLDEIVLTEMGTRPLGSRDFGIRKKDLIDEPVDDVLFIKLKSRLIDAIARDEPRFDLDRVVIEKTKNGSKATIIGSIQNEAVRREIEP